jgi:hypothetical protein
VYPRSVSPEVKDAKLPSVNPSALRALISLGLSTEYIPDFSARISFDPDCLLISTSLAKPSLGTKRPIYLPFFI